MRRESVEDFERLARASRRKLGAEHVEYFDAMTFLTKLKEAYTGFNYHRLPDTELVDDLAYYDPSRRVMFIRESGYQAANFGPGGGDGRARMTIFHEGAHLILGHKEIRHRSVARRQDERLDPRVRRDEREAKRLAPALVAPFYLIRPTWDATEIARRFGLSREAANIRFAQCKDYLDSRSGHGRSLPQSVLDFLKEAASRGYKPKTDLD